MTALQREPMHMNEGDEEILSLRRYHYLAMRTAKSMDYLGAREHAALGLVSDCGELASVIKAWKVYGKPLDVEHAKEELGDVLWFVCYAAHQFHLDLRDVATKYVHRDMDLTRGPVASTLRMCEEAGKFALACGAFPEYERTEVAILHLTRLLEYWEEVATYCQLGFQEVATWNVAKLRVRYPDKYSDEAAIARADKPHVYVSPRPDLGHVRCATCGRLSEHEIHTTHITT